MLKFVRHFALAGAASRLAAQVVDTTPRDTIPVTPVTITLLAAPVAR